MFNGIIIDDEKSEREALMRTPTHVVGGMNIKARLHSVGESIGYITWPPEANLVDNDVRASYNSSTNGRKKTRLIVKRGLENIVLCLEDIVLIYTQNKLVYVIDRLSKKYISDKNLNKLQQEIDNLIFFRANRQYIVNINYIKSFKPHERVKLLIDITIPEIDHSIAISQETAPAFRKWMLEA